MPMRPQAAVIKKYHCSETLSFSERCCLIPHAEKSTDTLFIMLYFNRMAAVKLWNRGDLPLDQDLIISIRKLHADCLIELLS